MDILHPRSLYNIGSNKMKIENYLYDTLNLINSSEANNSSIVLLAMKILEKYINIDHITFYNNFDLKKYFTLTSITCLWISYKFIIDYDDIGSKFLQTISNSHYKLYLIKEREILELLNYNIYKISKEITYEEKN